MFGKLAEKDLDLLMRKTKFTEDDILEWFAVFKTECPDGLLHKQTVSRIFKGKDMSRNSSLTDSNLSIYASFWPPLPHAPYGCICIWSHTSIYTDSVCWLEPMFDKGILHMLPIAPLDTPFHPFSYI